MTSCSAGAFKDSAYAREIEVALKAVRAGAFLTTAVQKDLKKSQETSQKADDSPVTVADYAAQAVVSWCVACEFG
jgi:3'(2'), 5'-bisphosphate nucleotidase